MSNIKINDIPQRVQYSASLNQTQFTVPFPFFENNFIVAWQDGIQIFQGAAPGQYLLTGVGAPSGGLLTLNTPALLGSIITIQGVMPIDRTSIYSATISNLTGSDLNGDFNREVVMMKQIETTQSLLQTQYAPWAIVSQDPNVTTDRYLPILNPLYLWRKNAVGDAIEQIKTPAAGGLAPDNGTYLLQTADADLPDAVPLNQFNSGFFVNQAGIGLVGMRVFEPTINQTTITNTNGLTGNPRFGIADNVVLPGTAGMGIPAGTTLERVTPIAPSIGFRFNTDTETIEGFINGSWVQIPSANAVLFLPLVGGTMSGNINMNFFELQNSELLNASLNSSLDANNNEIINIPTPLNPLDAANKAYVDAVALGLYFLPPAKAAATGNFSATYNNGTAGVGATLTASITGAASLDGVPLFLNDIVLFAKQSSSPQNGIYFVSQVGGVGIPAIYTRVTYYDKVDDIDPGDYLLVINGVTLAGSQWMQTAVVNTIGTDPISFTMLAGTTAPAGSSFAVQFNNSGAFGGSANFTANSLGEVFINGMLDVDNINFNGNTIQASNANGGLVFLPNGTGTFGFGSTTPRGYFDILGTTFVSSGNTNTTMKSWVQSIVCETNTNGVFSYINPVASAGVNLLNIGGGFSGNKASTSIVFYAAPDVTTNVGSNIADITSAGIRFGAANSRITTILNDGTLTANSPTALATQQSIKTYVDAQVAAAASFPSGTRMLFQQTTAPTGWTKDTTAAIDNGSLRTTTGTVSTGGTVNFTTAFASQAVSGTNSATTLTASQIPAHTHPIAAVVAGQVGGGGTIFGSSIAVDTAANIGGGGSHTHVLTGTAINLAVKYYDVIIAQKN